MKRRAFTLVELLVVIAIIGILVALLLPAVQAAREAARRMSCTNNLAQLILAVHSYEMAHEAFPPGTVDAKGPIINTGKGYHHNWIVRVLPYIEETTTYNAIDQSVSVYHKNNVAANQIGMRLLSCPSSPSGTSYGACHNHLEAPIDVTNTGVFHLNNAVKAAEVTDGLTHTLFLGEMTDGGMLGWMSGTNSTLRNTGLPPNAPVGPMLAPVGPAPAAAPLTIGEAAAEALGAEQPLSETIGQPAAGPNAAAGGALPVGGFSSVHPAGANFAFGDGHIRFITETISPRTFRQMGHRADGTLIVDR